MPEGDTVWLAGKRLHDALSGAVLTRTDFRVPALATADLRGRTLTEVVPRGKHLLLRTTGDGPGPAEVTVHTHFRMDGSWHLYRTGERWRGGPGHAVRVVLATERWQAVGYRLHDVAIVPTAEEGGLVGHLGPDVLGPGWDLDEALRRLLLRPDRQVGPALLDQRNLAGIGNLYKAEALFLRGLHPWLPVDEVGDLPALVGTARRLMLANRDRWEQATTGSTRRGEQHWVYGRAGSPCRRCGTRVQAADQPEEGAEEQQRVSFWCPHCQPAAEDAGQRRRRAAGGPGSPG